MVFVHMAVGGDVFDDVFLCCPFPPRNILDEIWNLGSGSQFLRVFLPTYALFQMYELLGIPRVNFELDARNMTDESSITNSFGKHCGASEAQKVIKTISNELHVEFTTDGLFTSEGFNITYSAVKSKFSKRIL